MSAAAGCTCGEATRPEGGACGASAPVVAINGIALPRGAGQGLDDGDLRELAWGELLRQEAVRQGLLPPHCGPEAPPLAPAERQVIETMLERAIEVRKPDTDECRRYYEARRDGFVEGRMVHLRHILFAVTAGVDVRALAARAEQTLLELTRKNADAAFFAALARELSNCPSGAQGGDLGWIGPRDCAEELAGELFPDQNPSRTVGLRPRLVHSRYGFHIVEVLDRRQGRQLAFEEVHERIGIQLEQQTRAKALHQYIRLLAGQALVEGICLQEADSPLVQ